MYFFFLIIYRKIGYKRKGIFQENEGKAELSKLFFFSFFFYKYNFPPLFVKRFPFLVRPLDDDWWLLYVSFNIYTVDQAHLGLENSTWVVKFKMVEEYLCRQFWRESEQNIIVHSLKANILSSRMSMSQHLLCQKMASYSYLSKV